MAEDYYSILGVSKSADNDEIKSAYKKMVRKYHPDLNKGDKPNEEKFKKINEAYETLKDAHKKKQYDTFGSNYGQAQQGWPGQGQGRQRYYQYSGYGEQGFDFDDVIRQFGFGFAESDDESDDVWGFRSSTSRRRASKGQNIQFALEITLEDAFHGATKKLEIPTQKVCDACEGNGAASGHLNKCSACGGSGQIKRVASTMFGHVMTVGLCSTCRGAGQHIDKKCEKCRGAGVVKDTKVLDVKIPRGVVGGTVLRLSGGGFSTKGGTGDLYLQIKVKPHPIFDVQENNLYCKTKIDLGTAMLGGELEIPTINGKAKLKIPAGTQSGTVFRMREMGMPNMRSYSKQGDQLVKVQVDIPANLTKEQREAILQSFGKNKKAETKKGFFEKMKDFFE